MFDFKYKEDVENCYRKLKITSVPMKDRRVINIKKTDSLIDLSPCIGIFQEAIFFENYDIENDIKYSIMLILKRVHRPKWVAGTLVNENLAEELPVTMENITVNQHYSPQFYKARNPKNVYENKKIMQLLHVLPQKTQILQLTGDVMC